MFNYHTIYLLLLLKVSQANYDFMVKQAKAANVTVIEKINTEGAAICCVLGKNRG